MAIFAHLLACLAALLHFTNTTAHTPKAKYQGEHHARPHTLHPTLHPELDTADHVHLQPAEGLTLHYHDPHASFPAIRSFASMHISGFIHPAVSLEHSMHILSTVCDDTHGTLTVTFANHAAWAHAFAHWEQHPRLLLVAFEDTCGKGRESGERSVHLVQNLTSSSRTLEIRCKMTEIPITAAIHPDREVDLKVTTFEKKDEYRSPVSRVVTRGGRGGGGNGPPRKMPPDARQRLPRVSRQAGSDPADPPRSEDTGSAPDPESNAGTIDSNDDSSGGSPADGAADSGASAAGETSPNESQSGGAVAPGTVSPANDSLLFDDSEDSFILALLDAGIDPTPFNSTIPLEPTQANIDSFAESLYGGTQKLNEDMGYIEAGDSAYDQLLDQFFPTDDIAMSGRGLSRCGTSWFPWSLLADCILLPLLEVVLPPRIYSLVDALASLSDQLIKRFFARVAKIIRALLSESGYTPSGEVTFDTNKSYPMEYTEDFGPAYKLFELGSTSYTLPAKTDPYATGSFAMYCVGCRVDGFFKYTSKFRFTITSGFVNASVTLVDGRIDFAAGFGFKVDLSLNLPLRKKNLLKKDLNKIHIIRKALSPLEIPGILIVGPFFTLDAGVDLSITAAGKFLTRNNIGWSNMTAHVDLLSNKNSGIGNWVQTKPVPFTSVELDGGVTLAPFVSTSLEFGVDILRGELTISGGVEAKASLPLTISAKATASSAKKIAFKGCQGFKVALAIKLEAYIVLRAGKFEHHLLPQEYEKELFSKCIKLSDAKKMDNLVPKRPPHIALPPLYANQTYRTIDAHLEKGLLNVVWFKRPISTVFAIPPVDDEIQDVVNRLFISSDKLPTNASTGTYDGRVFHYFSDEMDRYGVSRLEVAGAEAIPEKAVVVAFRSEAARSGKPGFIGGVTTDSTPMFTTYFFPVVCESYFSNEIPRIFLAKDAVKAPKQLKDLNNYTGSALGDAFAKPGHKFGGPMIRSCHFVHFVIN